MTFFNFRTRSRYHLMPGQRSRQVGYTSNRARLPCHARPGQLIGVAPCSGGGDGEGVVEGDSGVGVFNQELI